VGVGVGGGGVKVLGGGCWGGVFWLFFWGCVFGGVGVLGGGGGGVVLFVLLGCERYLFRFWCGGFGFLVCCCGFWVGGVFGGFFFGLLVFGFVVFFWVWGVFLLVRGDKGGTEGSTQYKFQERQSLNDS